MVNIWQYLPELWDFKIFRWVRLGVNIWQYLPELWDFQIFRWVWLWPKFGSIYQSYGTFKSSDEFDHGQHLAVFTRVMGL